MRNLEEEEQIDLVDYLRLSCTWLDCSKEIILAMFADYSSDIVGKAEHSEMNKSLPL